MVTISHIVQKLVDDNVFIQESMSQNIISYAYLAEKFKPDIEEIIGKTVKKHAIEMALRRYSDQIKNKHETVTFDYSSDIIMKTKISSMS
jgi:hypothetical protein